MNKNLIQSTILFFSILVFVGCQNNQGLLKNTKWRDVKFAIDSSNYLTELEKQVYSDFDTSKKLYSIYKDSILFTYVEGNDFDTSNYKITKDTLFTIYKSNYRDTCIILKLSKDSLILHCLAGVKIYSIRMK